MWRSEFYLPQHNTITYSLEEIICIGIHGQHMFTVRVLFQRCVDPVHESKPFLLWTQTQKTRLHTINIDMHMAINAKTTFGLFGLYLGQWEVQCICYYIKRKQGFVWSTESDAFLPEKECCVPALESSDVPPIAKIPSFLLMAFRKLFAMSLLFSSWKICADTRDHNIIYKVMLKCSDTWTVTVQHPER